MKWNVNKIDVILYFTLQGVCISSSSFCVCVMAAVLFYFVVFPFFLFFYRLKHPKLRHRLIEWKNCVSLFFFFFSFSLSFVFNVLLLAFAFVLPLALWNSRWVCQCVLETRRLLTLWELVKFFLPFCSLPLLSNQSGRRVALLARQSQILINNNFIIKVSSSEITCDSKR